MDITSVMVTGKVPIRDTEVLPLREAPLQPSSLYPDFILHLWFSSCYVPTPVLIYPQPRRLKNKLPLQTRLYFSGILVCL